MYKPCKINLSVKPVRPVAPSSSTRTVSVRPHQAVTPFRNISFRNFATATSEKKTIDPYAKARQHRARPGSKEALQESDFAAEADARNFASEPDYDRPENPDPKSTYTDGHPHDLGLKHPFKKVLNSAENPKSPSATAETTKAKQAAPEPTASAFAQESKSGAKEATSESSSSSGRGEFDKEASKTAMRGATKVDLKNETSTQAKTEFKSNEQDLDRDSSVRVSIRGPLERLEGGAGEFNPKDSPVSDEEATKQTPLV